MAIDRMIYWGEKRPNNATLEKILHNYVGKAGRTQWSGGRLFCALVGRNSYPLKGIPGVDPHVEAAKETERHQGRWIEIYHVEGEPTDVMTRFADVFTNAVADGFIMLLTSFYKARITR